MIYDVVGNLVEPCDVDGVEIQKGLTQISRSRI